VKGCSKTLAEAIYKAAKSVNNNFLSYRTIGGINTELQLHWVAYKLGILKDKATPVDIKWKCSQNSY